MPAAPNIPAPPNDARLRLLLVKLKHIGDALLLTPTLTAIRAEYPNAEIWVVVRKGTEGILAGCSAIDQLVTVTPVDSGDRGMATLWRDFRTWLQLRRQRFDYAFELTDGDRGRWLAGMSGARNRCVNTSHYKLSSFWKRWFNRTSSSAWTDGHRVEKDFHAVSDFLPLGTEIPALCFEEAKSQPPELVKGCTDYVVIHPGTRWVKKRWPKDYWLQLIQDLLQRADKVVISSGPDADERSFAADLVRESRSDRVISVDGQIPWSGLAGLLHKARVFVGVDTAAMHLAAACQCPTVTFFARSVVSQWRPWKVEHKLHYLEDIPWEEMVKIPANEVMLRFTPEMAIESVDQLIKPSPAN